MPAPVRWRAASAADLVWACYDQDFVLFHRPSGHTHFVNAATALLLTDVLLSPQDAESAAHSLLEAQRSDPTPDYLESVLLLLLRLEDLGLVERWPA